MLSCTKPLLTVQSEPRYAHVVGLWVAVVDEVVHADDHPGPLRHRPYHEVRDVVPRAQSEPPGRPQLRL